MVKLIVVGMVIVGVVAVFIWSDIRLSRSEYEREYDDKDNE